MVTFPFVCSTAALKKKIQLFYSFRNSGCSIWLWNIRICRNFSVMDWSEWLLTMIFNSIILFQDHTDSLFNGWGHIKTHSLRHWVSCGIKPRLLRPKSGRPLGSPAQPAASSSLPSSSSETSHQSGLVSGNVWAAAGSWGSGWACLIRKKRRCCCPLYLSLCLHMPAFLKQDHFFPSCHKMQYEVNKLTVSWWSIVQNALGKLIIKELL